MVENAPYLTHHHNDLTIEGYSRAAVQSYWRIPELKIGFDLGAQPWAALVVMEGNADVGEAGQAHQALTAEGPVSLHEIGDWRLFETEWLRRHTDPPTWATALVELRPTRLFSHAAR